MVPSVCVEFGRVARYRTKNQISETSAPREARPVPIHWYMD